MLKKTIKQGVESNCTSRSWLFWRMFPVLGILCTWGFALHAGKGAAADVHEEEVVSHIVIARVQKAAQKKKDDYFTDNLRKKLVHKLFLKQNEAALTRQRQHVFEAADRWQERFEVLQRRNQEVTQQIQEIQGRISLSEFFLQLQHKMHTTLLSAQNLAVVAHARRHLKVLDVLHKNIFMGNLSRDMGFLMGYKVEKSFDTSCAVSTMLPPQELVEILGPHVDTLTEGMPLVKPSEINWSA